MFPDDSIQKIYDDWWIRDDGRTLGRGRLIKAFVPHVNQVPYTLTPVGRASATEHEKAIIEVAPLRMGARRRGSRLPVAAMTLADGELWTAYKAKVRPCLVISDNVLGVNPAHSRGMPAKSTAPVLMVAPYYGADRDGTRAGYKPALVERIRHAEYAQLFWDKLPLRDVNESILRLDHLQPVGEHYFSYEITEYRLSDDAIECMDEWVRWVLWGRLEEDSLIAAYRKEMLTAFC